MRNLINRTKVKAKCLELAMKNRPSAKFTRVSPDFLDALEDELVKVISSRIHSHPSNGKTLKP